MKVEEILEEGVMTPYKAKSEISKLAIRLKIASSDLMYRYKKRLDRFVEDTTRALRVLETDLNVPRGTLKGFDELYRVATA